MKKLLFLVLLLPGTLLFAQSASTVSENNICKSPILGHEIHYSVYLPAGYHDNDRTYPVLYLLHGYTDDHTAWIQYGNMQYIADHEFASGKTPEMIILMPDAGVTWYVNDYSGKVRYEDAFFHDFMPFIEKTYRVRPGKQFRAIAGLSMGGYGALLYSLKHPDLFAACVAMSPAVFTNEEILAMNKDRKSMFESLFGKFQQNNDGLNDYWEQNSVLDLVKNYPDSDFNKVRFYIDCGDKDFLYRGNAALHVEMRDRNIPHEFRMRDGGHTWSYWRYDLRKGLYFVGKSFQQ
ncbi:MAG: alpha/beta hydrolase [Microbacter sp.]